MPTEWWLRPVSSAWRVGEQSAVVWKRVYLSPSAASRSKVGVLIGPPKALEAPKPQSSISTTRTFGRAGRRAQRLDGRERRRRVLRVVGGEPDVLPVGDRQGAALDGSVGHRSSFRRVVGPGESPLSRGAASRVRAGFPRWCRPGPPLRSGPVTLFRLRLWANGTLWLVPVVFGLAGLGLAIGLVELRRVDAQLRRARLLLEHRHPAPDGHGRGGGRLHGLRLLGAAAGGAARELAAVAAGDAGRLPELARPDLARPLGRDPHLHPGAARVGHRELRPPDLGRRRGGAGAGERRHLPAAGREDLGHPAAGPDGPAPARRGPPLDRAAAPAAARRGAGAPRPSRRCPPAGPPGSCGHAGRGGVVQAVDVGEIVR